jgi:4-amino-4-deoxy-L-arabinose transferase
MINLISGIIVVVISIWGYYYSFKSFKEDRILFSVLLLMLFGLLLRVYLASDLFLHEWDERYHALVAKNLIDFPLKPMLYANPVLAYDIENWPANHVWLHKQPFPLWTMALSMKIFGVNELALRLPSVLLTFIGIYLTFEIGRYLFSKRVGFIAAFLYSISGVIIEVSAGRIATDHVDVFFLFFVELGVFLAIKFAQSKKQLFNVLCGIAIGLAVLSKWLPALIVVPIWLLLLIDSKRFSIKEIILNMLLLLGIIAVISLPWQWYIFEYYPLEAKWESEYNFRHFTEALEDQGGSIWYHFDTLRIIYGELIYLVLIWLLVISLKRIRNMKRAILAVWIFIPFIFFTLSATKMQGYLLFTAPALFISTALFWDYVYRFRKSFRYNWLVYTLLFLLLVLPVRYTFERLKVFEEREKYPEWVKEYKVMDLGPNSVVFNVERPIEMMFYTDCTAYKKVPSKSKILEILEEGYAVYMIDDGSLDESYTKIDGVIKLPLVHHFENK